eukprot:4162958-Amphidinium_carterae.1
MMRYGGYAAGHEGSVASVTVSMLQDWMALISSVSSPGMAPAPAPARTHTHTRTQESPQPCFCAR